jgi:Cu2+-exporting ATPase
VRQAQDASNPVGQRLSFAVPTVHCAGCIGAIENGVGSMEGVRSARVNLSQKRLLVDADGTMQDAILDHLANLGYQAQPLNQDVLADAKDPEAHRLLLRMAVAGFAMMNVMILSVSVWSGAEGETRNFLHWVSAAITLPTISFTSTPFWQSALYALRRKRLNMDVPITLAIFLAVGLSVYETWVGGEEAYFDAALSLTFFLLLGRYLNHRTRVAARSAAVELAAMEAKTALRVGTGEKAANETVAISDLAAGDIVLVHPGMNIPIDGVVVTGDSDIDKALLTGESLPERATIESEVFAGTRNLTGPLEVRVLKPIEHSVLRRISELVSLAEASKSHYTGLAEKAAAIYAPVVHLLAFAAFVGWYVMSGDMRLSLNIAVSVLIITCPCALGLAVPAVMTAAVSRLFRSGVLIKDGTAIERLAEVDAVIFDKTGTLTQGEPVLDTSVADANLSVAAALAQGSAHPLSKALVAATRERGLGVLAALDTSELPGKGIEATVEGQRVRLGRADWIGATAQSGQVQSWLQIEDQPPVCLPFTDVPRVDAKQVIAELSEQGYAPGLLTGDRADVAEPLARDLGITSVLAGVLPEEKVEAIGAHRGKVLMVGDGLNDAAAMGAAHVSIAPATAIDATRATADCILLGNSLSEIPQTLSLARQAKKRILENFAVAAVYNAVAVPLAVLGFASPLAAAIAMSSSSIVVSLNALRLLRSRT